MSETVLRGFGRILGTAIVVGAAVATLWVWWLTYRHPRTDDAAVRANVVGIASAVSGPIVDLRVVDNQLVHEGDLLFLIDERPYVARVEANRAALSLAEADLGRAARRDRRRGERPGGPRRRRGVRSRLFAPRRDARSGAASSRSTRSRRLARSLRAATAGRECGDQGTRAGREAAGAGRRLERAAGSREGRAAQRGARRRLLHASGRRSTVTSPT